MNVLLKALMSRVMAKETGGEGTGGGLDGMDLGTGDIDYDDVSGDRGDEIGDETAEDEAAEDEAEPEEEAEEAEEDEAEPEEEEAEEGEEPKAKAKKDNKMVPRERLNEEARKRKEEKQRYEAEMAKLREQLSRDEASKQLVDIEADIDALETEYAKLSSEGLVDQAAGLLKQIRVKERELLRIESQALTDRARSAAKEEIRVETLVETLTEQYPVIDPDAEEYDQDVVDMIEGLRSRYMASGQGAAAALKAAASKVLGRMQKPVEAEEPAKGLSKAPKADEKRAAAVKKAVTASKGQPPKADVGADHDKRGPAFSAEKIAKMTEEEYEKLPENVRAKARGDFV
jgi:hypothetical protein